jgi:hypothetical protein
MLAYDVDSFYILRSVADDQVAAEDACLKKIQPTLAALRRDALSLTDVTSGNRDKFRNLFVHVWDILATLPDANEFSVPCRYASPQVTCLLSWASDSLFNLHFRHRPAGDHRILNGAKGTGKTMMLQVMGACAAVLSDVLIVYYSFEQRPEMAPLPSVLAHVVYTICSNGRNPTMAEIDEQLSLRTEEHPSVTKEISRYRPLFLFDEFTLLYYSTHDLNTDTDLLQKLRRRGSEIMSQLSVIGKLFGTVVVLTASEINVARYIHPTSDTEGEYIGYPTLNNGIYFCQMIPPLRTTGDIIEYCHDRFAIQCDLAQAEKILHFTGGVGRFIDIYMSNNSASQFHSTFCVERFFHDSALLRVSVGLLETMTVKETESDVWQVSPGLSLEDVATRMSISRRQIDEWCDSLIFHRDMDMIQFLIPALGRRLWLALRVNEEMHDCLIFKLTRLGFRGANPGKANERFLMSKVHQHIGNIRNAGDSTLVFHEDEAWVEAADAAARIVLSRDQLFDTLWKWKVDTSEIGLDRVWFVQNGRGACVVHGLQLKIGADTAKVTAGSLEAQREKESASRCDDTKIAGILAKAERGFVKVLQGMHDACPDLQLELGTFTLYTNKPAQDAAMQFRSDNKKCSHSFEISKRLFGALKPQKAFKKCKSFVWEVHDGMDWIYTIVADRLHSQL